jgi:hypothetical protein
VKIENAKVMTLGDRKSGTHRYITVELDRTIDMASVALNLVPSCDWISVDRNNSINGRFMEFDISQHIQQGGMQSIQTVYIDNGPNNCALTLEVMSTKQRVTCPPNSQGWFPLICALKDGRFRLGALDKVNNLGKIPASWDYPAQASGVGFSVVYKPCFIFTDQAVPPCVWDCRQKSSAIVVNTHVFTTTLTEQITPSSNRRMGLGFRALENNWSFVLLLKFEFATSTNSVEFWRLLPGEQIRFEGDSCPEDIFVGQANVTGDVLEAYIAI